MKITLLREEQVREECDKSPLTPSTEDEADRVLTDQSPALKEPINESDTCQVIRNWQLRSQQEEVCYIRVACPVHGSADIKEDRFTCSYCSW